jgi:hypothetical protein
LENVAEMWLSSFQTSTLPMTAGQIVGVHIQYSVAGAYPLGAGPGLDPADHPAREGDQSDYHHTARGNGDCEVVRPVQTGSFDNRNAGQDGELVSEVNGHAAGVDLVDQPAQRADRATQVIFGSKRSSTRMNAVDHIICPSGLDCR